MNKQEVFFVTFWAPGAFFGEQWTQDIESLDPLKVEFPSNAYAFTMHKREDVVEGDNRYKGHSEQVGPMYYHPESTITTLEQVKAGDTPGVPGPALLGNMECNNWNAVVWTRWGNWPQPFDPAKHQILRPV